jgi:hypothetical protein
MLFGIHKILQPTHKFRATPTKYPNFYLLDYHHYSFGFFKLSLRQQDFCLFPRNPSFLPQIIQRAYYYNQLFFLYVQSPLRNYNLILKE